MRSKEQQLLTTVQAMQWHSGFHQEGWLRRGRHRRCRTCLARMSNNFWHNPSITSTRRASLRGGRPWRRPDTSQLHSQSSVWARRRVEDQSRKGGILCGTLGDLWTNWVDKTHKRWSEPIMGQQPGAWWQQLTPSCVRKVDGENTRSRAALPTCVA